MNSTEEQRVQVVFDRENAKIYVETQNVDSWTQYLNAAAVIIMHVAVGGCLDEPLTFADECLDIVKKMVEEALEYELGIKELPR